MTIKAPDASRQVRFHQLLVAARKTWLADALGEALRRVDPKILKAQLGKYAPADAQKILAAAGVRDEYVFPTPVVLERVPNLVGYYRLLLGLPQKRFYASGTGMGQFKSMERSGTVAARQRASLPTFCKVMGKALAELVGQLSPQITQRDVSELPLLTLGAQFQGANNVKIGKEATEAMFLTMATIARSYTRSSSPSKLQIKNASGRNVTITLATEPDVRIEEEVEGVWDRKVAIEIKGGTDKSNAYNRAGEAEKSHLKARAGGFRDFWTVIAKKGLNMKKLKAGSPTTTSWFDVAQVLGRRGPDWEDFRRRVAGALGIPV